MGVPDVLPEPGKAMDMGDHLRQAGRPADDPLVASGAREILTAVGEVVYEWSIPDDTIRWGANALAVLKAGSLDRISTGRAFAALADPGGTASRHDTVINSVGVDRGRGVPYEVEYALLPDGEGSRLWIEDVGRWYAGPDNRPRRAHGIVRVINERHEREQRLAFLSRFDELTGYYNRSHLLERLADALGSAERGSPAFLVVAVDNFRAINEAYGFEVADNVLAAVAHRIHAKLRDGDALGRYTGNRLGIVILNCSETVMQAAAERFQAAVSAEVITAGAGSVAVTISVGAVALPRYGRSVHEAMARAEEALHLARTVGGGHYVAYAHSPEREERRRCNAALSSELLAAAAEKRFELAFQPVVRIATGKPAFYEALVRLRRPGGAATDEGEFVALAERLGLVRLIDRAVLDLAVEALAAAPAERLSINVSAATIGDREWLDRLTRAAQRHPGLAGRMVFEITETAVIRRLDEAAAFIGALHELGGQVAIDDFGAGFSSFRNLRSLAIDIVKIAGSFIEYLPTRRDDQAFVKALIALARDLGIETVAEWVGNAETIAVLGDLGVDLVQGNMIGPAAATWPPAKTRFP